MENKGFLGVLQGSSGLNTIFYFSLSSKNLDFRSETLVIYTFIKLSSTMKSAR
jgi:hypothetical protein